jgi:hypothetical protein
MVEWVGPDSHGDGELREDDAYKGLLCNRFTEDGSYRVFCNRRIELGVFDIEEAKAIALTIWSFNK